MNCVWLFVADFEQTKFVHEVNVTTQPEICVSPEQPSFLVSQMRIGVDQRSHSDRTRVSPGLCHEAPIEVWLQTTKARIVGRTPKVFGRDRNLDSAVEHNLSHAMELQDCLAA